MRIGKRVRRVSVGFPAGESHVYGVWKLGWDMDCKNILQRSATAAAIQEESLWVDFLTKSKHSGINAIVNDDGEQGHVCQDEWAKPESISENSNRVGDLNLLKLVEGVNVVLQSQEGGEHVTRHYVRRRKDGNGGNGAVLVQFDCTDVDMNKDQQTVSKNNHGIYELKQSCVTSGEEIQLQGSLRTNLSMAGNATCTISKKKSLHDKKIIQNHLSREPEGSNLLHALYLQLLAAGKEGLTVKELFASFKRQLSLPGLDMDCKNRIRAHLKTNPCFGEVKGRYLLQCKQIVQANATMSSFKAVECCKSSVTRLNVQLFESIGIPTALHFSCNSNDINEAIQTSRKTNEIIIEEALSESAIETQRIQHDAKTIIVSTLPDFTACDLVTTSPTKPRAVIQPTQLLSLKPLRRKKKPSLRNNKDIFQYIKNGRATPGALIALQAKIVAESGVQIGAWCSRKDDCRSWQCPLMAKEGHALCEHHIFLKERKKSQYAEDAKFNKTEKLLSKQLQEVPVLFALSHVPKNQEQEDTVADHVVEALVTLKNHVPTDAACQYHLTHAIAAPRRASERIMKNDEPKRTSQNLLQHLFTNAPKQRLIAAKKTTMFHKLPLQGNEQPAQQSLPIPPLQFQYGFQRKIVKNKSLLSF